MHILAAVNSGFVGRVLKEIAIKKKGREGEMFSACVLWLEIGLRRPPRSGAGVFLLRCGRAAPSQSSAPPHPAVPWGTLLRSLTAFLTKVLLVSWILLRPSVDYKFQEDRSCLFYSLLYPQHLILTCWRMTLPESPGLLEQQLAPDVTK